MFQIQLDTFVGVERILLVRFAVMAAHPAIFVKAPVFSRLFLLTIFPPSPMCPAAHITTIFTLLFTIFTHVLAIFTEVVMSCVA